MSERWRIGRTVGRTIYIQSGDAPTKADTMVGVMDTPELARIVVEAVNRQEETTPEDRGRQAESHPGEPLAYPRDDPSIHELLAAARADGRRKAIAEVDAALDRYARLYRTDGPDARDFVAAELADHDDQQPHNGDGLGCAG